MQIHEKMNELNRFETEIDNAMEVLIEGGVLIYPTDTIWGIGCDATRAEAVQKIYRMKRREESKSLVILVSDWDMLEDYIDVMPRGVREFLMGASRPTTVIYKRPMGLASNVVAADDTVAIRIVEEEFCKALIRKFGKPIVSTSANYSGEPSPTCFSDIDPELLTVADYVVNLSRDKKQESASQIVMFDEQGRINYIRK